MWDLDRTELVKLEARAKHGDQEAAIRIADYYRGWRLDEKRARQWYKVAARNGSVEALYQLANSYYAHSDGPADLATALEWLQRAESALKGSDTEMLRSIVELRARVRSELQDGD